LFPSLLAAVAAIDTPAPPKYPEDFAQAATLKLLRTLLKLGIKDAADSQLATACQFVIGSLAAAGSLNSNDKSRVCEWVKNVLYVQQDDEAGFVCSATSISRCGANALLPGQMMNVAMTYSALSLLTTCGDDLGGIDAPGVARFISRAQTPSGAFASHKGHTEVDARFCFAAVASLYLLSRRAAVPQNFFASINVENLLHFFVRCQSFDGGFSLFEGGEAHGGSTFCCVASMWLLQQYMFVHTNHPQPFPPYLAPSSPILPPTIDISAAQRWCCLRVRFDFR
jgi:geranylgeranyl transferase type-1 subunit beta